MSTPRIVERALADAPELAGIDSPLLRRIYAGRGVRSVEELDYRLAGLPHYRDLKGIDAACAALREAVEAGTRIVVVGDFDADGATSSALVCDVLEALGARSVESFVPHRAQHGYGLSPAVVAALGAPQPGDLIVTVDNGIASVDGVEAAHAAGWRVVICDHHLPGQALPAAEAIVNPNQPGCDFACKTLAGVGVAFYLMAALRADVALAHPDRELPAMADYLDLVAVGTVADVVALTHVNRTLVAQGLRRIQQGRARPGIAALIEVAGRDPRRLDAADIGFAVAPRLNAAGRLEDMRVGVACLRARDGATARSLASQLAAINQRRRSVQQRMQQDAEALLDAGDTPGDDRAAITVYRADWHEGVVGLIAGRLRERHHRPVVAFAPGAHGLLKGSARSIPGLHIRDALAAVDAEAPGLIERFGGHAQAAGLSLAADAVQRFEQAFERAVAARLTPEMINPDWVTDGELDAGQLDLVTAERLRASGPWGAGFEEPLFHGDFDVVDERIVGDKHLKLRVRAAGAAAPLEAMIFNQDEPLGCTRCTLVYRLAVNEFRERRSANLIVAYWRPIGGG